MVGVAVTRHPDRDSPRVDGMGGAGPGMELLPVIAQAMCLTLWALLRAGVEGGVGDGSSSRALTLVTPWHLLRPSSSFPEAQEVALCQKDVPRMLLALCYQGLPLWGFIITSALILKGHYDNAIPKGPEDPVHKCLKRQCPTLSSQ